MKDIQKINNPNRDEKIIDACSIFGAMDTSGKCFSGQGVISAIANMRDRGNGLGGGFAIYGLYPEHAECYAFHIMFLAADQRPTVEEFLKDNFTIVEAGEVSTRRIPQVTDPPLVWRYFLKIKEDVLGKQSEEEFIVEKTMMINTGLKGSFVFSGGKNMAAFKGVGFPEEMAEFFRLEDYKGYIWTAHGRFPTNSPGWWGGAHPFSLLDWTVVHNGEISSYGTNRRFLEQYGYQCTMQTDTEVVAYAADLLMRKHNLPVEVAADVMAAPFWHDIERKEEGAEKELLISLRQVYAGLLLNGPFTVIISRHGQMIGLTDRVRLRPLTVGTKDDMLYLSSEESAIRLISPQLNDVWIPMGGEPIIGEVGSLPTKAQSWEKARC
jgi:glutamate synthase domain-containing protein 1